MTTLSTGRKALSALVVAAVVGVALAPATAFAKGGHGHGGRYVYGAAALAGGLILGAVAASAADYDDDAPACWTEKRVRFDAYGDRYVQKVRVCD